MQLPAFSLPSPPKKHLRFPSVVTEIPIFSRKTLSALAFSPDGKLIVTGEVGAAHLLSPTPQFHLSWRRWDGVVRIIPPIFFFLEGGFHPIWDDAGRPGTPFRDGGEGESCRHAVVFPHVERAPTGRPRVGCGGTGAGLGVARSQARRGLRRLFPQRQVSGVRGVLPRHGRQRLGLEGELRINPTGLKIP